MVTCLAFLVAVMPECCVKKITSKTWTGLSAGTLANSADADKTLHNAASDQDLHCLLKLQELNGYINSL